PPPRLEAEASPGLLPALGFRCSRPLPFHLVVIGRQFITAQKAAHRGAFRRQQAADTSTQIDFGPAAIQLIVSSGNFHVTIQYRLLLRHVIVAALAARKDSLADYADMALALDLPPGG